MSMFIYVKVITGRLEKWWDFELGLGGCCEVGVSEMAETWVMVWRRWMPWFEVYCHSLEQEIMLGLRCGTEKRENLLHKGLKEFILGTWRTEVTHFTWLLLLYPMPMTACKSHFCWWKCGCCIFCPTVISLSLYLSIQYHIPYGIIQLK